MPYTLKTQQIAVKDPDTGVYSGVDILAEQTTEGLLTEITATGEAVKADVSAQMATERSDFNTYVSGKEAELDQYKSTTETNINTYVTNKNQEIATMIADADEDVSDLEDRKQDVATAVSGMLSKGVDNSLTTANVPAESKAVGDLFETIVQGKSTQPNDKWNRLWIKPSASDVEIPTMDEFDELKSAFETVKSMTVKCPLIDYGLTGLTYPAAGQVVGRSIQTDGSEVASYYAATSDFFAVNAGNVVSANLVTDANNKHIRTLIATYSGSTNSAFIERLALVSENGTGGGDYVIPETVKYVRIVFIRPTAEAVQMTQTDIDTYFNATISAVGTEFNRIKAQSAQNQQAISAVNARVTANENINILPAATYVDDKYAYNNRGSVTIDTANTAGLFTIDVEKMRGYDVNVLSYIAGNLRVILANTSNEVLESASGTDALAISWTISNTAKYLYISTLKTRKNDVIARLVSKDAVLINLMTGDTETSDNRLIISKNLLSTYQKTADTVFNAQGEEVASSISCVTDYIAVPAGKTLVLSRDASTTSRTIERIRAANFYDSNKIYLSTVITSYTGAPGHWLETITTPDDCAYVRLNILQATFASASYYMLEIGNTPSSEYEAYWPTYTVPPANPYFVSKKLCVFGDSLAADGYKGHNTWIDRVGNYYGFGTVYNRGEGGSFVTLENASGTARSSYGYVDADGYAYMRTAYTSQQSSIPSGYTEINAGMSGDARVETIPEDTDVLIIEAGINDWDSTTHTSDAGAELFETSYGTMLSKIVTRLPHAKIFCCLCPYYKVADGTANAANLDKHREIIRKVARNYGCTVIDLRTDMGVNAVNVDDYSSDGLHYYLSAGKNRMANTVIGAINGYVNTLM